MDAPHRYFILNKPSGMVSQFVSNYNVILLGNLDYKFPEGTHAIGRLDSETEGLLLLTTNKKITGLLFNSPKKHFRTYLALVRKQISEETFIQLRAGITVKGSQGTFYNSVPHSLQIIEEPLSHYAFAQDERCKYPHTWVLISLTEGKYHQVRKMLFTAGHRCLRLIRLSIEDLTLQDTKPGEVKEIEEEEFFRLLRLGEF